MAVLTVGGTVLTVGGTGTLGGVSGSVWSGWSLERGYDGLGFCGRARGGQSLGTVGAGTEVKAQDRISPGPSCP